MINVCTFDLILSSTFNGEGLYFILQARLFSWRHHIEFDQIHYKKLNVCSYCFRYTEVYVCMSALPMLDCWHPIDFS